MAEKERLTKKERREIARAERKEKEAAESKAAQRRRLTSILVTVLVLGVVVAVVLTAVGGDAPANAITLDRGVAEEARLSAGCEIVDTTAQTDREHLDPSTAPPADAIYTTVRPTHSGSHYVQTSPVVPFTDRQLEERATTHNLEHGAVMVWYDPEQLDGATLEEMEAYADRMASLGFQTDAGAAIMVSPFTEPGIQSGKAIALRAWSVAVDCDEWNEDAVNSFVIENYGEHGVAPESFLGEYPEGALVYSGEPAEPAEGTEGGDAPAEGDSDAPTEGGATATPTESGS